MDKVDNIDGNYRNLSELGLAEIEIELIRDISSLLPGNDHKYLIIDRGLSGEKKVVVKSKDHFPLLAKFGKPDHIRSEVAGYKILSGKVPLGSLSEILSYEIREHIGVVVSKYATKGRVKRPINRLDVYASSQTKYECANIVIYILDEILKKCHFKDGSFEFKVPSFPALPVPEFEIERGILEEIQNIYGLLLDRSSKIQAPHGIIHGDLHPKNILLGYANSPILIDYSLVSADGCIFSDYARLESFLQFQITDKESIKYHWRNYRKLYNKDHLIFPSSFELVGYVTHTIRSILWKNCISKSVGMSSKDVDSIYRVYLARNLISLFVRSRAPQGSRQAAQRTRILAILRTISKG